VARRGPRTKVSRSFGALESFAKLPAGNDAEWRPYQLRNFGSTADRISNGRATPSTISCRFELGGRPFGITGYAWDLRNVWPESKAEAEQKDAVENALHEAVCYRGGYRGLHLSLEQAESAIARDWTRTPIGLPTPLGN
jgi:hypothetical protein